MKSNLPSDDIRLISIDYIQVGLSKKEICSKYHITYKLFNQIHIDYELEKKKVVFTNKVLEKDLLKISALSAKGYTEGIQHLVDRISRIKRHEAVLDKEGKMLPVSMSNEILTITRAIHDFTKHRESELHKNRMKAPSTVEVIFAEPKKIEPKTEEK